MATGIRESVNLFEPKQIDVTDLKSGYTAYYPTNLLNESAAPIEFIIPATNDAYLNLKDSFLYLRIRVLDSSGEVIAANTAISITNFPIASLFEKAETYFNDKLVNTLHNYGYLGYLAVLLCKGKEEKKASLLNGSWVTDSLGTATEKNVGYGERIKHLEKSKS